MHTSPGATGSEAPLSPPQYELRLYVAGATESSVEAIQAVTDACRRQLAGRHELEVIDIYQLPQEAQRDAIVAVPTLVRSKPLPRQRIVGNLGDSDCVATALARIAP